MLCLESVNKIKAYQCIKALLMLLNIIRVTLETILISNIFWQDLLVTLSTLLRGSIYEKLRWTFKLYDINGDGCITRSELADIVVAIHELMGRRAHQVPQRPGDCAVYYCTTCL
jgi:hypothetical protein